MASVNKVIVVGNLGKDPETRFLPDGKEFVGVDGLKKAVLARPDMFVGTIAEKMLIYSVGRGLGPSDGAVVRKIVREARNNDYRFSAIVLGIVNSTPFQMRRSL